MLSAGFKALGDLFSTEFRSVLLKALGLTLALFVCVLIGVEFLLVSLTQFSWPWADWVLGVGTGVALVVAFFFLMSPVTAGFAGLFLDQIAEKVEARHYPHDRRGTPLPTSKAIGTALQFFLVVLVVNLAVLPVVLFGVGAVALVGANAYLLSREYFEMVAMRHMPPDDAKILRRENGPAVFLAGLVPAVFSLVPVVNLLVPLFATSFFTHFFKSVRSSSA
jgi:CysZ protein